MLIGINNSPKSTRLASNIVRALEASVEQLPMREAVRYTDKNLKWTISQFHVKYIIGYNIIYIPHHQLQDYSSSHANALLEHGVLPGDHMVVWMPECKEKVLPCTYHKCK